MTQILHEGLGARSLLNRRDEVIVALKERKDTSFELFLWVHRNCSGFSQNGNSAKCDDHKVSASGEALTFNK